MKCIIIGLGNFGMALAQRLTAMGYEVIGVDKDIEKVNLYKDSIKNTICLDINKRTGCQKFTPERCRPLHCHAGKGRRCFHTDSGHTEAKPRETNRSQSNIRAA